MAASHLFDEQGQRVFFTEEERAAFIAAAGKAPGDVRTFCGILHYTGCNFKEALNLTPSDIDVSGSAIVFHWTVSHQGNKRDVSRAVPVPAPLIELLDEVHGIRRARHGEHAARKIWPLGRVTMWKHVTRVIAAAGIHGGPHAVPKAIRHGFTVQAIRRRILLTRLQAWLGHAHTDTTSSYIDSLARHAPEMLGDERAEAALLW